jgi:hypothetical protein
MKHLKLFESMTEIKVEKICKQIDTKSRRDSVCRWGCQPLRQRFG